MKNNTAKKYLISCIIIATIFTAIIGIVTKYQTQSYTKKLNQEIAQIIVEVRRQYPEIKDENIIKILNGADNNQEGKRLLEKYGITEEVSAIKEIEEINKKIIITNISILGVFAAIITIIFIIYIKHRQRKINQLDNYIQKISRRDYSLDIEEGSEDELNSLKNSLYKITVLLKEEAENKKLQNEAILTSVSDISHQLKTFLTSMQLILDNLLESKEMDEKTRERFLLEASKQIKGTNFLILSLLKLSKLDAKVVEFENKPVNLEKMINEILENLDILIELKQVKIIKQFQSNAEIIGDYNWNKEAIQNIIKNAIEHTGEGRNISIRLLKNDVYTSISIEDEGQGIEKEELKHIFERFYKAKGSKEESYGIGLSLSKSIIEKQNGYISVESEIGKGTVFTIKYLK